MKVGELRQRSDEDLHRELRELLAERFKLSLQGKTQQLVRYHRFKQLRVDIARIKTIMRERADRDAADGEGR